MDKNICTFYICIIYNFYKFKFLWLDENFSSFAKGKSKQDAEIKAANKLLKKICE